MFHVVLVAPEIPPNTGNIIRLCANTGAKLHLVEPLGFDLSDAQLRRAGMDYAELANVLVHPDWTACRAVLGVARLFALTTKGGCRHTGAIPGDTATHNFHPGDAFVFGGESRGLPAVVLADIDESHRLRLPLMPGNRSLNLSNTVAVMVYEAWRQQGFAGGQ
ncbi:MAG: tRNA (cytidine/uridine-2'-O-)-methyltransferase [Rhodocyclaceae bacterium]|nr:MAG: tRNA (cytidine/uridine-2'-O-)-methyltransferase [Rhodocyclaceae bacterium]TND01860.1 MAG: tRNA (cytidine/uridine-2'-O-)-methyltransferase [Rhodocyclaceae bacterium]